MSHISNGAGWLGLGNQVCVVTGGASGIGAEVTRQLARAGANVAVLDMDAAACKAIAEQVCSEGLYALGLPTDVSDEVAVRNAANRVRTEFGPCNILINNAALRHRSPLLSIDIADWERVLKVNLTGALVCAQMFGQQMMDAGLGGSIVHVSSLLANHPQEDASPYCASKAGLEALSRSITIEWAQYGIRSNVVSPGFTRTPANEMSYSDRATLAAREQRIPSARIASASDVANVIVMLASQKASYINGEVIQVDGGVSATLMTRVPRPTRNE